MEADQSKIEHGYDTYKLFMIFQHTDLSRLEHSKSA